jgi:outer membrane protein
MGKMRFFFLWLICLGFHVHAQPASPSRWSLDQCIRAGLENNLNLKGQQLLVESQKINLRQSKADLLPNLNGSLGFGFNQGRNLDPITNVYINQELISSGLNLNSNLVLFNGFRLHNLIAQNRNAKEAAEWDEKQSRDNLALNILLAYFQVLSTEDQLELAGKQMELTQAQIDRAEVQVKEGATGNLLQVDLKAQLASEKINLLQQENSLKQFRLALCQLMQIDFQPDLALERLPSDGLLGNTYDLQALLGQFASVVPGVKAGDARIRAGEKAVAVARSNYLPQLSFTGNLGSSYSSLSNRLIPGAVSEVPTGDYVTLSGAQVPVYRQQTSFSSEKVGYSRQMNNNLGVFAGVSLQVPIFNSFQATNRLGLAKIQQRRAELDRKQTEVTLRQNLEQAWLAWSQANSRANLLEEQGQFLATALKGAQTRLENGIISPAEFLISKTNHDRAQLNVIQAKYETLLRSRILDYYLGKKTWE